MNYIIVQVDQDYGQVVGVRYIESFEDKESANAFILGKNEQRIAEWKNRLEYIEQWVDAIELPETDYHGWIKYLEQYHPFGVMYVTPDDFKENLMSYLTTHSVKLNEYEPPPVDLECNGFHIVKMSR